VVDNSGRSCSGCDWSRDEGRERTGGEASFEETGDNTWVVQEEGEAGVSEKVWFVPLKE